MDSLVLTIIVSIILMGLVVIGLAIGLILTGKSRLRRGCGYSVKEKKDGDSSCPICKDQKDTCDKS